MKITVEDKERMPAYLLLFEQIAQDIGSGRYKEGEKLPSEADLCADTGFAKGTVRRAFDCLDAQGYIKRIHGSGTYVLGCKPQVRQMTQFMATCQKQGLGEKGLNLLKEACDRYFTSTVREKMAIIDCTPEIGADISARLKEIDNFETTFYLLETVNREEEFPQEKIWITTKAHMEELSPIAENRGVILIGLKVAVADGEIRNLEEDCLLGVVYESQNFLMHVGHALAHLGLHQTLYLCHKEDWNDKKQAIRPEDIIWLVSPSEGEIIRQMKEMKSRLIEFCYEIEPESLNQIRTHVEKKRK